MVGSGLVFLRHVDIDDRDEILSESACEVSVLVVNLNFSYLFYEGSRCRIWAVAKFWFRRLSRFLICYSDLVLEIIYPWFENELFYASLQICPSKFLTILIMYGSSFLGSSMQVI